MSARDLIRLVAVAAITGITPVVSQAAEPPVYSDRPYVVAFDPHEALYVRFMIHATNSGTAACIDELEVYGPDSDRNLALASGGAKASASSCIEGYAAHAIEHLNDGEYGNSASWVAGGTGDEWAQIKLAAPALVSKVVFSRDRHREFGDRVPTDFEVRLSSDGKTWTTARAVKTVAVNDAVGPLGGDPVAPAPPAAPMIGLDGKVIWPQAATAGVDVPRKDALGYANLALQPAAKAAASSVYADGAVPLHQIAHLNDGLAGNSHSWISKGEPSWAEIDLGGTYWVYRVALGNDSSGRYADRAPASFRILTATSYDKDSGAAVWETAYKQAGGPALLQRREFVFKPVRARWVRVAIDATADSEARLDEIEIYGGRDEIPAAQVAALLTPSPAKSSVVDLLRYAFLTEEHAWLKTFGRADLDPNLVPYNGRVTEYPRHVGDDRLPLPELSAVPRFDGRLDDACWSGASQGSATVAAPTDFDRGPLVTYTVRAGTVGDSLVLAVQTDRLLSAHVAIISSLGGTEACVLAVKPEGLVLDRYTRDNEGQAHAEGSVPIKGAYDPKLTAFAARMPLSAFPECRERGLRIGVGIGGLHTSAAGRPIVFTFAPLAVAQDGPCVDGQFRVRFSVPASGKAVTVSSSVAGLESGVALAPGETKSVSLAAKAGPVGPQLDLDLSAGDAGVYALHLFRYDPVERTLALAEGIADRLATRGLDVATERSQIREFRRKQAELLSRPPAPAAERDAFFQARLMKRQLLLREPELASAGKLLFVKRYPFQPSHIYTDYTDAPFRPGGGIYVLSIPREDGHLAPENATLQELYRTETAIPRDPVATPSLDRVYFSQRPAPDGFYHLMSMKPDGTDLKQITDGAFHDLYPCPLPDGGLGMISTRCASRVLCFRWTSSVLFRLNPDGSNIRPLSFSSVSEWAPSVMRDGRLIWTRWEYIDKGADFSQTLWSINPDGTDPQLVFGNTIIQPNGYACGREVPGTSEISCTLVSHFGDINGPIALVNPNLGRFNQKAITSLTPEVPWPGMWPSTECFRDPFPIARDYFLCSHAPEDRFGLYVIDRYGNREVLYMDKTYGCMAPQPFKATASAPAIPDTVKPDAATGSFAMMDVYRGIEPTIPRGTVKWLRVVEEVRHNLAANPNFDHADFMKWYASPVDVVTGPFGWPSYTAKAALGLVPVADDGSAFFSAPAGKVLYFEALDKDYNELQRMRSVVQLQPGETRSCVGCHDSRATAPPDRRPRALAMGQQAIVPHEWGAGPFSYERVVQPVLDRRCAGCHNGAKARPDLRAMVDAERIPASYRSLIAGGWVNFLDCSWNPGGCEKREPLTFGTVKSRLWSILNAGHHDVALTEDEKLRIKTWTDLNCPLWPDYIERRQRPMPPQQTSVAAR